jgi:tetratricopeptide (TPR) repeat protein
LNEGVVRLAPSLLCLLALGCGGAHRVDRIVDGEMRAGRFVSHVAYAAYAEGTLLEADGDLRAAREAYRRALEADPKSVELLTVLGAIDCRLFPQAPWSFLDAARQRDASYEPQWRHRAECHRLRGELDAARAALMQALALDPERVETSERMLSLLEAAGESSEARRWLRALTLLFPERREVRRAELAYAERNGEKIAERDAERALARSAGDEVCDLRSLDQALLADDLVAANRCALALGMDASVVAFRALSLGKRTLAAQQGRAAAARDPRDPNAAVAVAVTADEAFLAAGTLADAQATVSPNRGALNDWARFLFAERLEWHVGSAAAIAWLAATGATDGRTELGHDDALLSHLVRRVGERLGLESSATEPTP